MNQFIGTLKFWKSVVCSTCLSSDRELSSLQKIQHVLHLIPTIQLDINEDKICWECKALLLKLWQFYQRAVNAQHQLHHTALKGQIIVTSLSNLKTSEVDYDSFEAIPDTQNKSNSTSFKHEKSLIKYNNPGKGDDDDSKEEQVEDFIDLSKPLPIQAIFLKRFSNKYLSSKKIKTGLSLDEILLKAKEFNENYERIKICDMSHINIKINENNNVNLENKTEEKFGKEIDKEVSAQRRSEDKTDIIKTDTEYTDENSVVNILTDLAGKIASKDKLIRVAKEDGVKKRKLNEKRDVMIKRKHKEIVAESSSLRQKKGTIEFVGLKPITDKLSVEVEIVENNCGVVFKESDLEETMMKAHKEQKIINEDKKRHIITVIKKKNRTKGKSRRQIHQALKRLAVRENITERIVNEKEMLNIRQRERQSVLYKNAIFKCTTCILGFLNEYVYQDHMLKHHEDEGPEVCQICKLRFKDAAAARGHHNTHYKTMMCTVCGYLARTADLVFVHQTRDHATPRPTGRLECRRCAGRFRTESELAFHMKLTHSQRFPQESRTKTLAPRRARPPSQRPFKCNSCQVDFTNESALQLHNDRKHRQRSRTKRAPPGDRH